MDWITGIQRAIDYTEAHITDEIDYEAVLSSAVFLSCGVVVSPRRRNCLYSHLYCGDG